jgi:multiple antibiotic resistance protein
VPLFLSALKHVPVARQRQVILREMLFALAILLVFLLGGGHMLRLLGLSQPALTVAGGVILMLIALRMIFPSREHSLEEDAPPAEPFLVPLAIPYVAGPSALATVLLMMSREPSRWMTWIAAVLLAWAVCLPIMLASTALRNLLGHRGLTAIERLMGLLLVTIAVQMMMDGVLQFWNAHRP